MFLSMAYVRVRIGLANIAEIYFREKREYVANFTYMILTRLMCRYAIIAYFDCNIHSSCSFVYYKKK